MKTAIFNHPFTDFYSTPGRMYSGILDYLANIISDNHEIKCFDVVKNVKKEISLPDELNYLHKFILEDITTYSFFRSYYKFGTEDNFSEKKFTDFNPDIILISSFAYCYFQGFKKQVDYLKKNFNVPIICGGSGPSSAPEYYLNNSNIDYVIKGPAEISLNKLLNSIEKNKTKDIVNVFYRNKSNKNRVNLDLDYTFKPYITKNKSKLSIQLTRGCLKDCSYCSIKLISGNKFRKTDLDLFKSELLKISVNNPYFNFEDDNITCDKNYFKNTINLIKTLYPYCSFGFENGIDIIPLDKNDIDFLVDNNVKQWNISMISASSEILNENLRNYTLEDFNEKLDYILKFDLPVFVYFISGLPGDNLKNVLTTLFYLAGKNVITGISTFYPVPEIKLTKNLINHFEPILSKGTSFYKWSEISTEDLISVFILSRFINAVKRYSKKDWLNVVNKEFFIQKNKITGNLTKNELSKIGIIYSIKKETLYCINKNREFVQHKVNEKIFPLFIEKFKNGLEIHGRHLKFDYAFFINVYEKVRGKFI